MAKLSQADITRVKGMGFLLNRGTDCFSGRILARGTVFSADELSAVAECARRFGNGKIAFTSRQTAEVVGIPYDKIDDALAFIQDAGLCFGGTGAKIRPITACKGTTCVYGNCDTQALAAEIHDRYYLGWRGVQLPHKFKIGVGGCPNSCMKPSLNDFGIEGRRVPVYDADKCRGCAVCVIETKCPSRAVKKTGGKALIDGDKCLDCGVCTGKCPFGAFAKETETVYRIYVGGTWGKTTRMGTPLSRYVKANDIFPILEKTMLWFRENGYAKERLGAAIDRIGADKLEEALFGDDLLARKDEILAAPLKERP